MEAEQGANQSFPLSREDRGSQPALPAVTPGFHVAAPPPPGTNVCAVDNGGCQQLCLYRGNDQRACACAHGMLAEDGASCREYAGYLLYSERTILKSVHLSDERNLNAPVQPFEDPEHMKNVIALAFDYRAGASPGTPNRIFFSDIHFGNIQQINDDGSGRTTIVESKPRPPLLPRNWGRVWGERGEGRPRLRAGMPRAPANPAPAPDLSPACLGVPDKQPVNHTVCY